MSVVEPDAVGALEPGHPGHQVRFRSFDHQVIVVGHQAVRMHLPARLLAGLGQGLDEIMPIHIIQEDLIPPVATAHESIHGPRVFKTEFARHAGRSWRKQAGCQLRNALIYGLTPFSSPPAPVPGLPATWPGAAPAGECRVVAAGWAAGWVVG